MKGLDNRINIQHNEDLDFLKGVGICMVVLGHCITSALEANNHILHIIKEIIYTFHMPIFFIVSGYIQGLRPYDIRRFKKFGFSQTRKYLLPYFVWSLTLYLFYYLLKTVNPGVIPERLTLNPIGVFRDIFLFKVLTGNVLWFVYILFIVTVVSYLVHSFMSNKYINLIFLLAVLIGGFLANNFISNQLFVPKRFLVVWIYYEIGVFIARYFSNKEFRANLLLNCVLVALYAIAFKFYTISYGFIGNSLKVLCALTAVFVLYSLSKYKNNVVYRILNYLGKRTAAIYYMHNPYIVLISVTAMTGYTNLNFVPAIVIAFSLGILVPLILQELLFNKVGLLKGVFFGDKVWAKQIN